MRAGDLWGRKVVEGTKEQERLADTVKDVLNRGEEGGWVNSRGQSASIACGESAGRGWLEMGVQREVWCGVNWERGKK